MAAAGSTDPARRRSWQGTPWRAAIEWAANAHDAQYPNPALFIRSVASCSLSVVTHSATRT